MPLPTLAQCLADQIQVQKPTLVIAVESLIFIMDSNITDSTTSGRSLMYRRKSVGQRMEPWATPALARYSSKDFPSTNT